MSFPTDRCRRPGTGGASTPPRSASGPPTRIPGPARTEEEPATTADPWTVVALLAPAGFVAGVLNTVAGGGSFLTLPLLILLGLPHATANGTNRLAILIQSAGATAAFRRADAVPAGALLRLGLFAILGAGAGSALALQVGETAFLRFLSIVMVLFALIPLLSRRAATSPQDASRRARGAALPLAFLAVGFYGGFLQAGVGFLALGATSWAGIPLVAGNAIKVACIFLFSIVSLSVFAAGGAVDWVVGIPLSLGTLAGALVGARLTLRAGERVLRGLVSVLTLAFAVALWLRA